MTKKDLSDQGRILPDPTLEGEIWLNARAYHRFAGDLDRELEKLVARWRHAAAPQAAENPWGRP